MSGALVVTGGGRGIGAEIARQAARDGMPIALLSRSRSSSDDIVREIEANGGKAMAIEADVGKEADVLRAFQSIDEAFGGVCGLINNAVNAGPPGRLADLKMTDLEEVFRTNVFGAFLCSREASRRLSTQKGGQGGSIVSMSSVVAVKTGAGGNWVHFAATKSAIETMSLGLAKELAGEGIRVNVVRCGAIATESRMGQDETYRNRIVASIPMGRMGEVSEVAGAVLWLLSPAASYVSGATLDVSGAL